MTENPSIQLDPTLNVPFLDQWLGTWFIEPERGRALHSAIRQLNIGVHLQDVAMRSPAERLDRMAERRGERQDVGGQPVAIDWEQSPRSRGAYGYRTMDGVAVLELTGSLMKQEASATESTSTVMMRRTVRKLMTDGQVKAVLFQIDSPGGTVAGIYELATDIAALAKVKPVHAHASNLCASAAYLLASQMRSISATASALVGSMGTFGVVYDLSEMAAKEGVKVHLLKGRINGKDALMKGAGTPGTAISPEQLARMQEGVDDLNQQFYDAVLAGPRKPKAAAVEGWFADAGVWVAAKAKTMGLIDRVESFDDMLARVSGEAKNAARDTTPSTTNKPAGDDGTNTGRRSESENRQMVREVLESAMSRGQLVSLTETVNGMSLMIQPNQQAGGTSAGEPQAEDAGATTDEPSAAAAGSEAEASLPQEADMSANAQQQQAVATAPAAPAVTPPASAPATAEQQQQAAPRPATIAELKAAFPGEANASFCLDAAEQAWTIGEAKAAHGVIERQVAARTGCAPAASTTQAAEQPAQQQAATAPATAATKKPGVPAIASAAAEQQQGGSAATAADGADAFLARRDQLVKEKGLTRAAAVMQIAAKEPDLHKAYMESVKR